MKFEDAEEFSYQSKFSRSKYRDIVISVIEHFKNNQSKNVLKITYNLPADAEQVRKGVKLWMGEEDHKHFICTKKNNIVYFVKKHE